MAKFKLVQHIDEETGKKWYHDQYLFWCKGCNAEHAVGLKSEGGHHDFNMDLNCPTISPSVLCNFVPGETCHSFIKEGKIQYLSDCWHELAGKTIELPEIE